MKMRRWVVVWEPHYTFRMRHQVGRYFSEAGARHKVAELQELGVKGTFQVEQVNPAESPRLGV